MSPHKVQLEEIRQGLSCTHDDMPCAKHLELIAQVLDDFANLKFELQDGLRDIANIKNSVKKLDKEVLEGNGKVPLIIRMDRLEQDKLSNDDVKREFRNAVIKTLTPVVVGMIALSIFIFTGISKYLQPVVDTDSVVKQIKQELKHESSNSITSDAASGGVRN